MVRTPPKGFWAGEAVAMRRAVNVTGIVALRITWERWHGAGACVEVQGFGGEGAGVFDGAGVFVAQGMEAGGGQRLLLAADALYFADPGVRVQVGIGEKLACVFLKSEISA
jgi:hypothetical protein